MLSPNVTSIDSVINPPLMILEDRENELKSAYPLLGSISDNAWALAINNAKKINVGPGTTLFSGAAPCNKFMLILSGTIRVYQTATDGREMTVYRVKQGDLCALSLNSMLKNTTLNVIADTETDVTALVINEEDFKASMNSSEIFRNYVLTSLTDRLCETMSVLQDTVFNQLNMRLACMLGSLFERNKGITLKITHQEIAHELGTTREVISRILKEFERQECVILHRGSIELASAEGLKWFAK